MAFTHLLLDYKHHTSTAESIGLTIQQGSSRSLTGKWIPFTFLARCFTYFNMMFLSLARRSLRRGAVVWGISSFGIKEKRDHESKFLSALLVVATWSRRIFLSISFSVFLVAGVHTISGATALMLGAIVCVVMFHGLTFLRFYNGNARTLVELDVRSHPRIQFQRMFPFFPVDWHSAVEATTTKLNLDLKVGE